MVYSLGSHCIYKHIAPSSSHIGAHPYKSPKFCHAHISVTWFPRWALQRPSLSHQSRWGDPGFLWKHPMGLASRVGEMGTFWYLLGCASFGFLWEPRRMFPRFPATPLVSVLHPQLHLLCYRSPQEAEYNQLPGAIGVGLLDNSFPEKEPVGACGVQSQQERGTHRSPTPKLQPLLVGYFNKNSSQRETGVFTGCS